MSETTGTTGTQGSALHIVTDVDIRRERENKLYKNARNTAALLEYQKNGNDVFATYQSNVKLEVNRANDLEYICDKQWSVQAYHVAMMNEVSWNSAVAALKAKALATIPPYWHIGLKSGTGGSLNTFYNFNGDSGSGKGVAMSLTESIHFVFPTYDILAPRLDRKLKSAQAIGMLYMSRIPEEDSADGKKSPGRPKLSEAWQQQYYSAIVKFTEVSSISSVLGQAVGVGYFCEAWSGDKIGGDAQDMKYGASPEAGRYRFIKLVGVQPGNAHLFLDHEVTGLAQRGFWVPVKSLTMTPDEIEAEQDKFARMPLSPFVLRGVPDFDTNDSKKLALRVANIKAAIDIDDHKAVRMPPILQRLADKMSSSKSAGTRHIEPIDSHELMAQLIEAVSESYMDDFHGGDDVHITEEDFQRAQYLMLCHKETRQQATAAARKNKQRTANEDGILLGIKQDASDRVRSSQKAVRTAHSMVQSMILEMVRDESPRTLPKTGITRQQRNVWDSVVESLVASGVIRSAGTVQAKGRDLVQYELIDND